MKYSSKTFSVIILAIITGCSAQMSDGYGQDNAGVQAERAFTKESCTAAYETCRNTPADLRRVEAAREREIAEMAIVEREEHALRYAVDILQDRRHSGAVIAKKCIDEAAIVDIYAAPLSQIKQDILDCAFKKQDGSLMNGFHLGFAKRALNVSGAVDVVVSTSSDWDNYVAWCESEARDACNATCLDAGIRERAACVADCMPACDPMALKTTTLGDRLVEDFKSAQAAFDSRVTTCDHLSGLACEVEGLPAYVAACGLSEIADNACGCAPSPICQQHAFNAGRLYNCKQASDYVNRLDMRPRDAATDAIYGEVLYVKVQDSKPVQMYGCVEVEMDDAGNFAPTEASVTRLARAAGVATPVSSGSAASGGDADGPCTYDDYACTPSTGDDAGDDDGAGDTTPGDDTGTGDDGTGDTTPGDDAGTGDDGAGSTTPGGDTGTGAGDTGTGPDFDLDDYDDGSGVPGSVNPAGNDYPGGPSGNGSVDGSRTGNPGIVNHASAPAASCSATGPATSTGGMAAMFFMLGLFGITRRRGLAFAR